MANPNIVNVATIQGKTTGAAMGTTLTTSLLANSSSSNKVFKINSVIVTNVDGSNNCQLFSSGNISKVVRENTGWYKVYFQSNMPDAHYCVVATGTGGGTSSGYVQLDSADFGGNGAAQGTTISTFNLRATDSGGNYTNHPFVHCAVFR